LSASRNGLRTRANQRWRGATLGAEPRNQFIDLVFERSDSALAKLDEAQPTNFCSWNKFIATFVLYEIAVEKRFADTEFAAWAMKALRPQHPG
jgi:hypothetical protein